MSKAQTKYPTRNFIGIYILLFWLLANSLNQNPDYYVFRNLSMIAYVIEIQKSILAHIKFRKFDQSEPGR